jgi:3-oxoacyl-[acyl-carrier-protein] synthase-3
MGIAAVKNLLRDYPSLPYSIEEVDLIVAASYTPYDTVHTLAHAVQRHFKIEQAQAVFISSACSSFVNALEIVQGYFAMGKAKTALIVASEHNTAYSDHSDAQTGHLWGDAAVTVLLSSERQAGSDAKIVDIYTRGLGHISKAEDAVMMHPLQGSKGIQMPNGKDVFVHACKYMQIAMEVVLQRNNLTTADLSYMVGHQANGRIIAAVAKQMEIPDEKIMTNVSELGNTGSPSNMLVVSQNWNKFKRGDLLGVSVFGGGYSCGAYLIRF